jgi:hypothetical protein
MLDLRSIDNLYLVLAFIVPGLVIYFVRAKFITGRKPSHTENLLSYLVLSLVYYGLTLSIIQQALAVREPWIARAAIWIALTIVGPAVFGAVIGILAQKQYGTRLAERLNIILVHVIPAAWDWRFSTLPRGGLFLLVTLSSGQTVAGFFGRNSFASSDAAERDLYVEEEYDLKEDGKWTPRAEKSGYFHSGPRD